MKINNIQEWQSARFDEAILDIIILLDEIGDGGHNTIIYQSLFKVLTAYIESNPNMTIVTEDSKGITNTDETYYWITYLFDTLYKIFNKVNTLCTLSSYKPGKCLSIYLEDEANKLRKEIDLYHNKLGHE